MKNHYLTSTHLFLPANEVNYSTRNDDKNVILDQKFLKGFLSPAITKSNKLDSDIWYTKSHVIFKKAF